MSEDTKDPINDTPGNHLVHGQQDIIKCCHTTFIHYRICPHCKPCPGEGCTDPSHCTGWCK